MTKQARVTTAFLLSPLATPLVFMLDSTLRGRLSFEEIPLYFVLHGFFAYLAVLLFGLPAFFIYHALRWTSSLIFLLCGGLVGFVISLLFIPTIDHASPFIFTLNDRMWFVFAGALSALLFRLLLPSDWVLSSSANRFP
jgi:hypothetical protein